MMDPYFELRLKHLEDNIKQDLVLLKDYEDASRDEDDPRRQLKYDGEIEQLRESSNRYRQEYNELRKQVTGELPAEMQNVATQLDQMNTNVNLLLAEQAALKDKVNQLKNEIDARQAKLDFLSAAKHHSSQVRLKHSITLDEYLDSSNPRYWPKRQDVEAGKLYRHETYIKEIKTTLLENKRCLLSGKSASGKTALAIAFGLQWCENQETQKEYAGSSVFYLDASRGYREETGENWHSQMCTNDEPTQLFIIDNCHLGTAAVNAFCFHWERQPPEHTLVLLISAPKVVESEWEEEPEDYFEGFYQAGAVVEVQPEQIYTGILRAYSHAYCLTEPERFVSVEQDLADSEQLVQLEELCGHNLAATSSILAAWGETGGRLSSITEDEVLAGLARRYLTQQKAEALGQLCCLAQFEIPAHERFFRQLPQKSIAALRSENLIVAEESPSYGLCYRLTFHPQVAAQIFQAHVKREVGSVYKDYIDDESFNLLKTYLSTCPANFTQVYSQLYGNGFIELQHRLLRNPDLQTYALEQFSKRPLHDVTYYLYVLSRIEPNQAKNLLENFIIQTGTDNFQKRLIKEARFKSVISFLPRISLGYARTVLRNLPARWVAERISFASLPYITKWISSDSNSLSSQLGYSDAWRQEFTEVLDINMMVEKAKNTDSQHFCDFIHTLKAYNKPLSVLFCNQFILSSFNQIVVGHYPTTNVIRHLQKINKIVQQEFSVHQVLNLDLLIDSLKNQKLNNIASAFRYLLAVDEEKTTFFINKLPPKALSQVIGGDLRELKLPPSDYRKLASLFILSEVVDETLQQSGVREIQLLLYNFSKIENQFLQIIGQFLPNIDLADRIAEARIQDLSYLLWSVRIRVGEELAKNYCKLIDTQLRSEQLENADLIELASLLWNLVHLSDIENFKTLEKPIIRELLRNQWASHVGPCTCILGITTLVRPHTAQNLSLPAFDFKNMKEALANWLTKYLDDKSSSHQKNPYMFALTVKGLKAIDESKAIELVRETLHQSFAVAKCLKLLQKAAKKAVTHRSREVLEETIRFVEMISM